MAAAELKSAADARAAAEAKMAAAAAAAAAEAKVIYYAEWIQSNFADQELHDAHTDQGA